MGKKERNFEEETQDKTKLSDGNPLIPEANRVNLSARKEEKVEYFLGFKRKNFNELWRWDNLESVNF